MNNKEYADYVVEQLTELRDLIIVIERGGKDTPDVLYKLAMEKSGHITSYIQQWRHDAAPCEVKVPDEYEEWVNGQTTEESVWEEKKAQAELADNTDNVAALPIDNMPLEIDLPDENLEIPEADASSSTDEHPNETVNDIPFIPVDTEMDTIEVDMEEFPENTSIGEVSLVVEDEDEKEQESDTEPECLDEAPQVLDAAKNDVDISADISDEANNIDEEQQVYNMGEPFDDNEVTADTNMTVGEMMSVRRAKELRRAISLNDRFRFRRELFGNSDVRMTETLALIDTMSDYGEAREYLLNDMGWDDEDPVVKEFLALVEKHFKQ